MKRFAQLYAELDSTNSTLGKLAALERYFRDAAPEDAAWAVYFLTGNKPRQVVPSRRLYELAGSIARLPPWLMDECYEAVGDLAETVAHVLPPADTPSDIPLHVWVERRLLPLAGAADEERVGALTQAWRELDGVARLVWNKLITGEFRIGVSARSVVRAVSALSGVDASIVAHRLAGKWQPTRDSYLSLISTEGEQGVASRPYPLFLAHALEGDPEHALGDLAQWQVEWKWDGIRAQIIRRGGAVYVWSRGDELINETFPDLVAAGSTLPEGTVIDGEIVVWEGDRAAPFNALQKRLGRKAPGKALLKDTPASLVAYDLLELDGRDIRMEPLAERREQLEALLRRESISSALRVSPIVRAAEWEELKALRATSRELGVEGMMVKRRDSAYGVGRVRGAWWKWKIEPYTVDAVIIYAQRGHGRRASLYTDYTFGVWDDGALVPFAKAYSGLTDEEIREVDRFVREHTVEKFGPVRHVEPRLVCELAFEAIQKSTRHKSGIAVRFPRIARLRRDKKPEEADTLASVRALLEASA
ncbi:MAG TPA: ATP-dependent DNA ligase [Burkholderiales bacterium]|nr:ATP-dependent DNA ligase [Burkholderiales bacterium]